MATDEKTGETTGKNVAATIVGDGEKHLVRISVDTDGDKGTATAPITATDGHPFWVPALGKWIDGKDLKPGQWLRTSSGTHVQVTAVQAWTQTASVRNLTVADFHTYYVMAGTAPVLVHNCGASTDGYLYRGLAKGHRSYDSAAEGRAVPAGGNSGILAHVRNNDTDSPFTSWSDDPEVAQWGAENLNNEWVGEGVMLRIKVDNIDPAVGPSRNIQIHDTGYEGSFSEDEHLLVGEIQADEISFDLGETWSAITRG